MLIFDPGRTIQTARFLGELFPASEIADIGGLSFIEFFQTDKETGNPKGIVAMNLEELK